MLFKSVLLSIAFWLVFLTGVRSTVIPPEDCGKQDYESLQRAAVLAARWMKTNHMDDGRYVYLYDYAADRTPDDYNEVRHAGVTMSLYQAAGRLQDADALETADSALQWMIDNSIERHGWTALAPYSTAKLGGSALMLISLAERRLATSDPQYDDLMHGLATFIAEMQRDDGGFYIHWNVSTDEPNTVDTSRYYPGESLWALALMHEAFPDEGWDGHAWSALEFITERRDDVENVDFPPLPDQWAAYGIAEMIEWGLTDQQADYARRLAGRFGLLVRSEAQRQGSWYGNAARGNTFGRASGVGTWTEALSSLWRASQYDPRLADLSEPIAERLHCVAGILAERQYEPDEAADYPRPELVEGAWFRANETRMDDQQHAFSGILYTLDMLDDNPVREPQLPGFPRPLQ